MKLVIDSSRRSLEVDGQELPLFSPEAFARLSQVWVDVGWSLKYTYTFTWMGRPVIQMPEDLIRVQELVHALQPHVLIETGVAHGGSLVFYASLFKALGRGRVIGVDVEVRPHNRAAIEAHPLKPWISLIEGDSVSSETVANVRAAIRENERVLVVLDSNHTFAHVRAELAAYSDLVTPGSCLIVADGVMAGLAEVPGGRPEWATDNPLRAVDEFLAADSRFERIPAPCGFNESPLSGAATTYWPGGWLRRRPG